MKTSPGPLRSTQDAIWCLVIQPQPPSLEPKFWFILGLLVFLLLGIMAFANEPRFTLLPLTSPVSGERP
jgi:hypothetical protein